MIRLREKAAMCNYMMKGCSRCKCCHANKMYKPMIEHIMAERIYNREHRRRILTNLSMISYKAKYDMAILLEDTDKPDDQMQPVASRDTTSTSEARVSDHTRLEKEGVKVKSA